jgi:adenosine 3'-phospho 5'-phosphosulfate transporter B2
MHAVAFMSATATFGLVILYDTIFKHGALTVATTMSAHPQQHARPHIEADTPASTAALRQFFSILLNAGIFGNFSSIGAGGWLGVGFVAAGVWIKMDRRFDAPASPLATSENAGRGHERVDEQPSLPLYTTPEHESGRRAHRLAQQYGVPLSLPFLFVAIGKAFAA